MGTPCPLLFPNYPVAGVVVVRPSRRAGNKNTLRTIWELCSGQRHSTSVPWLHYNRHIVCVLACTSESERRLLEQCYGDSGGRPGMTAVARASKGALRFFPETAKKEAGTLLVVLMFCMCRALPSTKGTARARGNLGSARP